MKSDSVPAWPVIRLFFEDDSVIADPAGVGDPIRVAAGADLAAASASAAAIAARRLEVLRCRVEGTTPDGDVWMMVVDADEGTLDDLSVMGQGAPAVTSSVSDGRGVLAAVPRRWWVVIGTATVAAVAIAVALLPRAALSGPSIDSSMFAAEAPAGEAPVPDAGQLPVLAPAGWDTYASWIIGAAKPGAAAVFAGADVLVLADGPDVIAVNSETGQQLWRSTTAGDVTALFALEEGDVVYAARANSGVSVLDRSTGVVLTNGEISARSIVLDEVPFAELPGQAGAVLMGTSWERRQVPAGAIPVGTIGTSLVSVSAEQRRLWVIASDDPVLPGPIELLPPAEGLAPMRIVAFFDGQLVLQWGDRSGPKSVTFDVVRENGLDRRGTLEASSAFSGAASIDSREGLLAIGSSLIDVEALSVIDGGGTVIAQAGYGWTRGGENRVRVSRDGSMVPMAGTAVIPDVVLPDGRAIVRAPRGAAGQGYYALESEPPSVEGTR